MSSHHIDVDNALGVSKDSTQPRSKIGPASDKPGCIHPSESIGSFRKREELKWDSGSDKHYIGNAVFHSMLCASDDFE